MEALNNDWSDKTILIVDDEVDNCELLCAMLDDTKVQIVTASNGKEALSTFRSNPQIDLILMDIKMPEMNGLEVTMEIRKTNSKIPIIAQTAYALSGDREKVIHAGCDDYISKPIDSNNLLQLISEYFT